MVRKYQLHVRMNDAEYSKLVYNSQRCGLSQAEYVRCLIRGAVPRESPPADYERMVEEIYRIANYLGEIANVAKASGNVESESITKLVEELYDNIHVLEDGAHGEDSLNERMAVYGPD